MKQEEDDADGPGLVFDETSEFVASVGLNPIVKREPREAPLPSAQGASQAGGRSQSRDVSMAPGDVALDELEAGEVQVKEEDDDDVAMAMLDDIEAEFKAENGEVKKEGGEDGGVGTSNEQMFSSGMAATLSILRQQGALQETSAEQRDREKLQRQRDLWLSEQRFKIAKRELERQNARGGNRDAAQREYDNRMREVQERRQLIDDFNTGYKPDVNIVYHDEHGRELSVKEAWKALSHKFHGKTPGKMKTEKKLKRIEEERKKLAMASGDTPLSMNAAFQARQEKTGQAHFVLSVGNRGSVPFA
jgi:U4/U6.U5 tri-snRNP-associated protein 1